MGTSRVQVHVIADHHFPGNTNIAMNQALASKLEIRKHPFLIKYGSTNNIGYLAFGKIKPNVIKISNSLASALRIPLVVILNIAYDPYSLRLRFGPLFGILINANIQENDEQAFGGLTRFIEECIRFGQINGLQSIVIPPAAINLEQKRVQGWTKLNNKWIESTFPLPDVIYNRITSRKSEQDPNLVQKLDRLRNYYRIPIFNEKFLDKYEVHLVLSDDHRTRRLLPETHFFNLKNLRYMCNKYSMLYIKPTNGSLGNGIIRLFKSHDTWFYQTHSPNGLLTRKGNTLMQLEKYLLNRIRRQPYIVQQGLALVTFQDRQIDFRVLVQKRKKGEWRITSCVARIANDHNYVSNLAQGGMVRKAHEVLAELDISSKPTLQDLQTISLDIANTFEQNVDGLYGELGIDLAIDQYGRIWIIEINSKPSKTDDTVSNPTMITRPSVAGLIEYVQFLSDFVQPKSAYPVRKSRRDKGGQNNV